MDPSIGDDEFSDSDGATLASREETELRDLESRLDKLKQPSGGGGNALFARGVGLVTSLGFILAGCLAAGFFLGQAVAARTGQPLFTGLGVVIGLAAAIFAVVKLMTPFLKGEG